MRHRTEGLSGRYRIGISRKLSEIQSVGRQNPVQQSRTRLSPLFGIVDNVIRLLPREFKCDLLYFLYNCHNRIPLSTSTKILGVSLDSKMTLNQHISNTCRSVYYQTRRINSIRQYLTDNAVKTLTQSVIISRLDYCNNVCIGLPMKSMHCS